MKRIESTLFLARPWCRSPRSRFLALVAWAMTTAGRVPFGLWQHRVFICRSIASQRRKKNQQNKTPGARSDHRIVGYYTKPGESNLRTGCHGTSRRLVGKVVIEVTCRLLSIHYTLHIHLGQIDIPSWHGCCSFNGLIIFSVTWARGVGSTGRR